MKPYETEAEMSLSNISVLQEAKQSLSRDIFPNFREGDEMECFYKDLRDSINRVIFAEAERAMKLSKGGEK